MYKQYEKLICDVQTIVLFLGTDLDGNNEVFSMGVDFACVSGISL